MSSQPQLSSIDNPSLLFRRLSRTMTTTIVEQGLIADGDHIMVAISGGKDSYTMLDLLRRSQRRAPIKFEMTAVHLDQMQPGYDGEPLRRWLKASGVPFEMFSRDTYSKVVELVPAHKTYCSLCSRLRRGTLYEKAEQLGCNVIALGHHRDDAIETLLLNLFYSGKMQAMPARYKTNDGRFHVIRPLIECAESDIAEHARDADYPILPCNLCSSQNGKRDAMAALISSLERDNPDVRGSMLNAIRNVRPTHLLDRKLADLWSASGADAIATESDD